MLRRIRALAVALVLLLSAILPCVAMAVTIPVVKIAVLNYPRYMSQKSDGTYYGFGIEYMEHLSQYGQFICNFVPMTLEEANTRISDGRIDLIPGHRKSSEREMQMLFTDLPMNIDANVLCCRADDNRFAYSDFSAYDGMTVGIMAGSSLLDDLEAAEKEYGIQMDIRTYPDDRSCHNALMNSEVDALMIGAFRLTPDVKVLARLSASPLYIACNASQTALLERINRAQGELWASEPMYSANLWQKYYSDISDSVSLSTNEQAYLTEHPVLQVGLLANVPVLSDNSKVNATGAFRDWFEQTYSQTGFSFEFTSVPTYEDLVAGLTDKTFDVIFPVSVPQSKAGETPGLLLLDAGFPDSLVAVSRANSNVNGLIGEKLVLCRDDRAIRSYYSAFASDENLTAVPQATAALDKVRYGEASVAIVDSAAALYLMEMPQYENLEIIPGYDTRTLLSAAVRSRADPRLQSVMNKYTVSLTSEATNNIVLTAASKNPYQDSVSDIIYRYRLPLIIIVLLLLALFGFLIMLNVRQRTYNRVQQENAEALELARKARQEAEAEYTRLSVQQEADVMLKQRLRFQAAHDELTGIYNMNGFKEAVATVLGSNPDRDFMIVRLDITRFKIFNDLFGIDAGNRLLRAVAQELDIRCNATSSAYARLTGDHFVLCLAQDSITPDELEKQIQDWLHYYSPDYELQECIGIYPITDREMDISLMCDRALLAQESVKDVYPPRVGIYDEGLRDRVLEEQWITASMRAALANHEFLPYFQPQYRISTGELIGAEVLSRWNNRDRGMIRPDHFIPIFEKNGFITEMDTYIWNQACRWLQQRKAQGLPLIPLSINISRVDIINLDLVTFLPALVKRYGLEPKDLRLEITESVFIAQRELMISTLCALRDEGFYIELDDFGTGYTSINILRDLPLDMIKLDMSFLTGADQFDRSVQITGAVIRLARGISMDVIAEGVETKAQLDFLSDIGCDLAQGYYYARPLPAAGFESIINGSDVPAKEN